jgi:glycosyltransferase involved in cell wall biosynthesis
LSAGSFRTAALVRALLERLPDRAHVHVITTSPNRYSSFKGAALVNEDCPRLTVERIKVPAHASGMLSQANAFLSYARRAIDQVESRSYDLVFGTSSRLMTAALSAHVARKKRIPLCLDIRDIFADTIKDVLPRWAAMPATPLFSAVERWTVERAQHVNLVSPGFEPYFSRRYPARGFTFFMNGIDDEFIDLPTQQVKAKRKPIRVLYAGNIGEGQGLQGVLPELAARLAGEVSFRVIGDGGRRRQLEERVSQLGCTNIEIRPPVRREQLIHEYSEADILFLHLNDYPAFEKVLPSKVFEYAATGKPIWAGVAGYAAAFIEGEIANAAVFPPCDVEQAVSAFGELRLEDVRRSAFVSKYARTSIMERMAEDISRILARNV